MLLGVLESAHHRRDVLEGDEAVALAAVAVLVHHDVHFLDLAVLLELLVQHLLSKLAAQAVDEDLLVRGVSGGRRHVAVLRRVAERSQVAEHLSPLREHEKPSD